MRKISNYTKGTNMIDGVAEIGLKLALVLQKVWAFVQTSVFLKPFLGVLGAAILFIAAPPLRPDGTFNNKEFVYRLAVAGIFSAIFGDWFVSVVPAWLNAAEHKAPFYMICGAPGYWISRAAALWLYNRKDKPIDQWIEDIAETHRKAGKK